MIPRLTGFDPKKLLTVSGAKSNFFDRDKIKNAVDRARRGVLSRTGAFVRTAARTSIRYREKPSNPGSPPSAHRTIVRFKTNRKGEQKRQLKSPLREFIFFSYDESTRSVVVGPSILNGASGARTLTALEYGGPSVVVDSKGRRRPIFVRPRPFMRPALVSALDDLARKWRDQVKG